VHDVAVPIFYRNIKLVQQELSEEGRNLQFFRAINLNPRLSSLIRTLDLSDFRISGLPWLIPRAMTLIPRLRSLHLQLSNLIQLDDQKVQTVFFGMPNLESLTIENTRTKTHGSSLAKVLQNLESTNPTSVSRIRSLTCRTDSDSTHSGTPAENVEFVDSGILARFLQRFPELQALDMADTSLDPKSLLAINTNSRLQFLRITKCQDSDTATLAYFLASHTAVNSSLVVLDGSGITFNQEETSTILENLPPTLRSLNLDSSMMTSNHVPLLQKLSRNLEELKIGNGLTMNDVEAMVLGPCFKFHPANTRLSASVARNSKDAPGQELVLGPMRRAVAICKLRRRLASVSPIAAKIHMEKSRLRYLNLGSMDEEEQGRITNSVLLGEQSKPLELIVVSGIESEDHRALGKLSEACGWKDKWFNGMVWVERG
jgi:hypothetical protein